MKSKDPLDNLRIASPCPVGWEQMTGDERIRLCRLCDLHVYNIAEMSRKEAASLIANSEGGRICARLFRRTDGTIITRDCPVGLRAIKRRVSKTATAVFATVMALCSSVAGQKPAKPGQDSCQSQVKITRTIDEAQPAGAMALLILDPNGAVVAGADIVVTQSIETLHSIDKTVGPVSRQTNDEGRVVFTGLAPGHYDVKVDVESRGFKNFLLKDLDVKARETIAVDITLLVAEGGGIVGLLALPLLIEKPRAGMMIIPGDVLRKLPY